MRKEFQVHKLNDQGLSKAGELAGVFSEALDKIEAIAGTEGRELSVVRTKLEEASCFARRAVASKAENQLAQ